MKLDMNFEFEKTVTTKVGHKNFDLELEHFFKVNQWKFPFNVVLFFISPPKTTPNQKPAALKPS